MLGRFPIGRVQFSVVFARVRVQAPIALVWSLGPAHLRQYATRGDGCAGGSACMTAACAPRARDWPAGVGAVQALWQSRRWSVRQCAHLASLWPWDHRRRPDCIACRPGTSNPYQRCVCQRKAYSYLVRIANENRLSTDSFHFFQLECSTVLIGVVTSVFGALEKRFIPISILRSNCN